jgi:hypothetical protein
LSSGGTPLFRAIRFRRGWLGVGADELDYPKGLPQEFEEPTFGDTPPPALESSNGDNRSVTARDITGSSVVTGEHTLPPRNLNAWIDGAAPKGNKAFKIFENIGKSNGPVVTSASFPEPDWADTKSIDLLVSLSSLDCEVDPSWHDLKLPRYGNSETVIFSVVAAKKGEHQFAIRVYMAKQMIQLQVLTFSVYIYEMESTLTGAAR